MVVYEVNLEINNEIYAEYYQWLITHVQHMLQFTGFKNAEIGLVQQSEEDGKKKIRVNYLIDTLENLQTYLTQSAETMRGDAIQKFGDQFSATRRIILDLIHFDIK